MKIDITKQYTDREGRVHGPFELRWNYIKDAKSNRHWFLDGAYFRGRQHPFDLIAEYTPTPCMELPNGDVIQEGGYGVTRDGRKVGPIIFDKNDALNAPFDCGAYSYHTDGRRWIKAHEPETDIIAAWPEPAADHLPHFATREDAVRHFCSPTFDPTTNERPFGLLSPAEQEAMKAWPHGWQYYGHHGWLGIAAAPAWRSSSTYRAKPALTKPSIDWSHVSPKFIALAVDGDGTEWLHSKRPKILADCEWRNGGTYESAAAFATYTSGTCDWRDSLVMRPGHGETEQ